MGLSSKENMILDTLFEHGRRGTRLFGHERRNPVAPDGTRIVVERNYAVVRIAFVRLLHDLHERLRRFNTVDHEPSAEEPVARMLAVGLAEVKAFDISRVSLYIIYK